MKKRGMKLLLLCGAVVPAAIFVVRAYNNKKHQYEFTMRDDCKNLMNENYSEGFLEDYQVELWDDEIADEFDLALNKLKG